MKQPLTCPYCSTEDKPVLAELVKGVKLYPDRKDLHRHNFWECSKGCGAYVGCHHGSSGGRKPLGRLADASLRAAKGRAHRAFDPLWEKKLMKRTQAYTWLAEKLGIPVEACHIGMFDVMQCDQTVQLCARYRPQSEIPAHRRQSWRSRRKTAQVSNHQDTLPHNQPA